MSSDAASHFVCHEYMNSWAFLGEDAGVDSIGDGKLTASVSGSSLEHFEIPYAADGVTLVGASDYVTLRKFELTSSSSFAFWVKPTAAVTSGALYTLRNTDASGAELRLEFTTAGVGASRLDVVKVYDPGSGAATTLSKTGASIDLPTGQWSLVTLVFAPPLLSVYLGSTLNAHFQDAMTLV